MMRPRPKPKLKSKPRRKVMTDNAQQLNNKSASAQGAPPPHGDKEPKPSLKDKAQPGRFETRRNAVTGRGKEDNRDIDLALANQHPQRIHVPRKEPRGTGTGEEANATRSRSLVDWPGPTMSHEEHVEELLTIAQINEDFNNEMNGRVFERGERIGELLADPPNPKDGEAQATPDAYEASIRAFEAADPIKRRDTIKGEMEARARRDRKQEEEMYSKALPSKG
jgi:hypothetical protein